MKVNPVTIKFKTTLYRKGGKENIVDYIILRELLTESRISQVIAYWDLCNNLESDYSIKVWAKVERFPDRIVALINHEKQITYFQVPISDINSDFCNFQHSLLSPRDRIESFKLWRDYERSYQNC